MLGNIVNTACIVAGTLVGTFFRKGLGEKYTKALFNAMGLAAVALGAHSLVQNMPKSEFPGLSILEIKDCKTLNYIPSLLVPILWFLVKRLF